MARNATSKSASTWTVENFQEERPLTHARFAADQATLELIQGMVRAYQAQPGR